ncbi:hyaluronidase-4-like [Eublepharis macularius]|uniref:Hyaluronidase n=1 Tax=Eublepharis macularius TaxID=481883 RepID=A0AA97JR37_EUBMA|nr:hyaluronidase-4-like [Eublepharis macularius]
MRHLWIKWIAIKLWLITADGGGILPTKAPLFQNKPFVVLWNAPTEKCRLRYNVDLHLDVFDIISNANETLSGSSVTIFYHNLLGYYPYFSDLGDPINGGIPQNENLTKHLTKAKTDINKYIPVRKFRGLAVIDWENWRPQWDRNWGNKTIYRNKSLERVMQRHPQWPEHVIRRVAKNEFEKAGKNFMNRTLLLAEHIRPNGLWGYYLYPDCYNYNYKDNPAAYTGECPVIETKRNDELLWLWKRSTALYPSIYLESLLKSSPNALKFVRYRVQEALRIASMARNDYALPVFVYSRPFYAYTFDVLTEEDLVHTIGESAAQGAAGVILWGSIQYASSRGSCTVVKNYIDGALGHYILNVTSAAKLCSKVLCKKNGRCIRKTGKTNAYLHLPSDSFKMSRSASGKGRKMRVIGKLTKEDTKSMRQKFRCQCYKGWAGDFCELPVFRKKGKYIGDTSKANLFPYSKLDYQNLVETWYSSPTVAKSQKDFY